MKTLKILKLRNSLFIMIAMVLAASCTKTNQSTNENPGDEIKIAINNNVESLNTRVTYFNEPIQFAHNSLKANPVHTWYYVAEVESPNFLGSDLSATHVVIVDDKAYVTYNRQGDEYAGGIEVIDLSNPAYPQIISQELYDGADVNAVATDINGNENQRKIWLALSSFKSGAVLRQVMLENGVLTNQIQDVKLSKSLSDGSIAASANGIVSTNDYVYVTAGQSHGGTFQVSVSDLSVLNHEEYTNAKFPAVNGVHNGSKQLSLRTGMESQLLVYHVGTNRNYQTIDIDPVYHQNVEEPFKGKSTLYVEQNSQIAFVASGLNGLKAYNLNSGNEVYYSPSDMLINGNTNGVSKDDDYVYIANGADGLFIGMLPGGNGGEIIPVQVWDMNESGASANLVETDGDWVFVAKGGGGLKILRKIPQGNYPVICDYDEDGVPECLIENPEELCESLLSDIQLSLPEYQNALVNHPEYFLNENLEIVLTEEAMVSVSFISEGAAFKNSFGYYTYHVDNPPQSAFDIRSSMMIIFPNASAEGSGGGLVAGDKIYQIGSYPAGTVIGYFMLANAWNGSEVTDGLYTHYTIPEFNQNQTQQHLLMYDYDCTDVLMGFEDVILPGGDKDFNDLIFKMNIEPMTAISPSTYVQIPPVEGK